MRKEYHVQLPMGDGVSLFTVCRCVSPEAAAEAVRLLLTHQGDDLRPVSVSVVLLGPAPDCQASQQAIVSAR